MIDAFHRSSHRFNAKLVCIGTAYTLQPVPRAETTIANLEVKLPQQWGETKAERPFSSGNFHFLGRLKQTSQLVLWPLGQPYGILGSPLNLRNQCGS